MLTGVDPQRDVWRILRFAGGSSTLLALGIAGIVDWADAESRAWFLVLAAMAYGGVLALAVGALASWRKRRSRGPLERATALQSPQPVLDKPDPGWKPALRLMSSTFNPFTYFSAIRGNRNADPITSLRLSFLGLVGAIPSWVFAFSFIGPFVAKDRESWIGPAVMGLGVATTAVGTVIGRRPLDTSSLEALASSYRSRFFTRVGLAHLPALGGVVGSFFDGWWVIVLGGTFSLLHFSLIVPGSRQIARTQEELQRLGSNISLIEALRLPIASRRRRGGASVP